MSDVLNPPEELTLYGNPQLDETFDDCSVSKTNARKHKKKQKTRVCAAAEP